MVDFLWRLLAAGLDNSFFTVWLQSGIGSILCFQPVVIVLEVVSLSNEHNSWVCCAFGRVSFFALFHINIRMMSATFHN